MKRITFQPHCLSYHLTIGSARTAIAVHRRFRICLTVRSGPCLAHTVLTCGEEKKTFLRVPRPGFPDSEFRLISLTQGPCGANRLDYPATVI